MNTSRFGLAKRMGLLLLVVMFLSSPAVAWDHDGGWWGWILEGWKGPYDLSEQREFHNHDDTIVSVRHGVD